MPLLSTSAGPVAPVFLQGFALGLGLIVAIGAQNAFVLRQGLRREHVATVVGFCAPMATMSPRPRAKPCRKTGATGPAEVDKNGMAPILRAWGFGRAAPVDSGRPRCMRA